MASWAVCWAALHTAGRIVYALSGAGLVAGALTAALRALPEDALVAAGFIGFAIAEAVAGGASIEADFASAGSGGSGGRRQTRRRCRA